MRHCGKCGKDLDGEPALGNRIKFAAKECGTSWIARHIKQLLSLIVHGFVRPEIEGYIEFCDGCFGEIKLDFGWK